MNRFSASIEAYTDHLRTIKWLSIPKRGLLSKSRWHVRIFTCLIVPVLLVLMMGCNATKSITLSGGDQVSVIDYSAERRGAYVRPWQELTDENGRVTHRPSHVIIAEPSPDVASEYTTIISAALQGLQGVESVEARAQISNNIVDLAKRSQTLQIQREALYRLSELYANGAITASEARDLYARVLTTIQAIAYTELANSNLDDTTKTKIFDELFKDVSTNSIPDEELDD